MVNCADEDIREEPKTSKEFNEIPRWAQIFMGAVFSVLVLVCAIGSLPIFVSPSAKNPLFNFAVGLILLFGCLWAMEKSVRLLLGKKTNGGLMSPLALRIVSGLFLCFPIVGIFTGYYAQNGLISIVQVAVYILIARNLNSLARSRERFRDLNKKP